MCKAQILVRSLSSSWTLSSFSYSTMWLCSFLTHSTETYLLFIKIILFSCSDFHTLTFNKTQLHRTHTFNTLSHIFYFPLKMVNSVQLSGVVRLKVRLLSLVSFEKLVNVFLSVFDSRNCFTLQIF